MAGHKLEGHAPQTPDSDRSVEDKGEEKRNKELLDYLKEREDGFVQFLNGKEKREVQLRELVEDSKREASQIATLEVKSLHSLFTFSF